MSDRVLPNSLDAESAVIGAMLLSPTEAALLVRERLTETDFYHQKPALVFRSLCAMLDRNEAVDLVTLTARLESAGKLEEVGGAAFLADLVTRIPTAANVGEYIGIVQEKSMRRRAISLAYQLQQSAFDEAESPVDLIGKSSDQLTALCQSRTTGPVKSDVLVRRVLTALEERWQSKREFDGLATGILDLDRQMRGMKAGEIVIVAGFPGEGKSALANTIADNVARAGHPVLYHNVEMLGEEQTERSIAAAAGVDVSHYKPFADGEDAMRRITSSASAMSKWPKWISDGAGRSAVQIVAESRRHAQQHGCALVVVDFLQDIPWPRGCDSENIAITQHMTAFKSAAMAMRCPWMILSQFNRDPANKQRRPRMQDLRGSGSIEQSAHKIILISRMSAQTDRDYLPDDLKTAMSDDEVEALSILNIAKARGGITGDVLVRFRRNYTRFENISQVATEQP